MELYFQEFDKKQSDILEKFLEFLRFETISSDKHYIPEMIKCTEFLENYLKSILDVEILFVDDYPPILFGQNLNAGKNKPTLLFYCHYDVQPADPIEKWISPPFSPEIRNGKIFCRGASDNKGQCFYTMAALKSFFEIHKSFPVNIKFIIEGQEEISSVALQRVLEEKSSLFTADYLLIVDGGFPPSNPVVSIGARGILGMKLNIFEGNQDLHSGAMGGIAFNPNKALAQVLSSFYEPGTNRVTVKNFYKDVKILTEKDKENLNLDYDKNAFIKLWNLVPSGEEKGFSPIESASIRPTLEINGIHGGYTGPGFKTVIPREATAYLSCRLVPQQNPSEIFHLIKSHIQEHLPKHLDFSFSMLEGAAEAWGNTSPSKIKTIIKDIYSTLYNKKCMEDIMGGSIPVTPKLLAASQAQPLLIGVSSLEDDIHAPNESFSFVNLKNGFISICELLTRLQDEK